jgi:hypothetical protein
MPLEPITNNTYSTTIQLPASNEKSREKKAKALEKMGSLSTEVLELLASKMKPGIEKKIIQYQHFF